VQKIEAPEKRSKVVRRGRRLAHGGGELAPFLLPDGVSIAIPTSHKKKKSRNTMKPADSVQSLAATGTGEEVEIRKILFETLRALCDELDVHEGDVVKCRAGTTTQLLLETRQGRRVTLQRDWARFIQVCPSHAA
jgi:DNA-binding Xre family transcriptional regulator